MLSGLSYPVPLEPLSLSPVRSPHLVRERSAYRTLDTEEQRSLESEQPTTPPHEAALRESCGTGCTSF